MGQYVSLVTGSTASPPNTTRPPLASARQNSGLLSYFRTARPQPHIIERPHSEVLEAHTVLCRRLPPELSAATLNYAEYWTRTTSLRRQRIRLSSGTTFMPVERNEGWPTFPTEVEEHQSWARFEPGEFPYLVSLPIGVSLDDRGNIVPGDGGYLKEVTVEITSRDQGWSDAQGQFYGTYAGSHSWFELCLIRNGQEVEDSRCEIQRNVHAGQYLKSHTVHLPPSHKILQAARSGDIVVLCVRAMYPGWVNEVSEASITISTSVFP